MKYTVKEINKMDAGGLWPARKIRCTRMNENLTEPTQKIKIGEVFDVLYSHRPNWETIEPSGFLLTKLKDGTVIVPGLDIEFEVVQEWDADTVKYTPPLGCDMVFPV